MTRYTIKQSITLGFLTHNDSYSMHIHPENGYLKFDGSDIIFVDSKDNEHVSHTSNNASDLWLELGFLELENDQL